MKGRVGLAVAIAALCSTASLFGARSALPVPQMDPGLDATIKEVFDLRQYTLQDVRVPAEAGAPAGFEVTLGGRVVRIELVPYSLRADDFTVLVEGADHVLRPYNAPPPNTMRGDVEGDPFSEVRATLIRGGIEAVVRLGDGTTWAIQPVAHEVPGMGVGPLTHVVFNDRDVAPPPGKHCGVPDNAQPPKEANLLLRPVGGPEPQPRSPGDRICDIAFDADFEYYQSLGSNVNNVINDIESIMNAIEGIYEFNTDISYEQTVFIVRTAEPDPYTSTNPNTLLGQFDTQWTNNHSTVRRDVAHLFTGKNIDGGVIGIAQLSVICVTANAYGLSQSRYTSNLTLRRSLTAHELGHNWSAQHCNGSGNCNIMCSCNGCGSGEGCTGIFTSFGAGEANQIINFRNSRTCLTLEPEPVAPPFSDEFTSVAFDPARWTYIQGAQTSTASLNPPSSPRAMQLNASGSGTHQDDDLRTNFIPLAGVTNPRVSYYVQARGVPAGKQMFVDIWLSNLRWFNINTLTSDGVDDTTFTQHTHLLTGVANAIHPEFRVRFRVDVDNTNQNWFVDNVYVGPPQGPATGACCLGNGTCVSVTAADCSTQGGSFQGDGTECGQINCPLPPGACCLPQGGCTTTANEILCISLGGSWQGSGTSCGQANCPDPVGYCCLPNGNCVEVADEAACTAQGGSFGGAGAPCDTANCPQPMGSCCLQGGGCIITDSANCAAQGGTYNGNGTSCSGQCAEPPGACCLPTGACIQTADEAACTNQGGSFNGAGSNCGAIKCPVACPCDWNENSDLNSQDFFDFLSDFFEGDADYNLDTLTNSQDFFDFLGCFFKGC